MPMIDGKKSISGKIKSIYIRDFILFINSIITSIVIARTLGPSILGLWVVLSLITSNSEAFFRIKVDRAAVYFIGKKLETQRNILDSINFIALFTSLILIFLINFFQDEIISIFFKNFIQTENLKWMVCVTSISLPIRFLNTNYSYFHISIDRIEVYNNMVLIAAISSTFTVFIFSFIFHIGIWSIILSSIFSALFSLFYGYLQIDRGILILNDNKLNIKENIILKIKLIKYGFNFYIGGILSEFQEQGVKNISLSLLSSSKLAFLGQGQSLLRFLGSINQAINTVLFPKISSSNSTEGVNLTNTAFKISTLVLLPISFLIIITCDLLIRVLYGTEFLETSLVMKFLIPGILFSEIASSLNSYFNGTGRAKILPIAQIGPVALTLFLGYILTKKIGLLGSCIAMSIGNIIYSITIISIYLNFTKQKIDVLIPSTYDFTFMIKKLNLIILNRKN